MSKRILAILLMATMIILTGCVGTGNSDGSGDEIGGAGNNDEKGGQSSDGFVLKAVVKSVESDYIEVEIVESDYAFGIYWVRTGEQTKYKLSDGSEAARSDIKAGQTVSISYSGQTMMSYPPQIVAWTIAVL